MKYCSHCGYKLDEVKFERKKSTFKKYGDVVNNDTVISYVCPRCGHLIANHYEEEDYKALARACHAELQRGRNSFAQGMSSLSIGVIALVLSIIFFLLSYKISEEGGKTISTRAPEFWVSVVLLVAAVILLTIGVIKTVIGISKQRMYNNLLKDINNKTFVQ